MARDLDIIQTGRLTLRGINETDAPEIVKWRSAPEVYRYFKNPHQISLEEHISWYNSSYLMNENRSDWMCIEKISGKKAGVFGLTRTDSEAEVNYLLAPDARHKGYASEAIRALLQYAHNEWNVRRISAEIHKENLPSLALVKRLGFELISAEGDFVIYGIGG